MIMTHLVRHKETKSRASTVNFSSSDGTGRDEEPMAKMAAMGFMSALLIAIEMGNMIKMLGLSTHLSRPNRAFSINKENYEKRDDLFACLA